MKDVQRLTTDKLRLTFIALKMGGRRPIHFFRPFHAPLHLCDCQMASDRIEIQGRGSFNPAANHIGKQKIETNQNANSRDA